MLILSRVFEQFSMPWIETTPLQYSIDRDVRHEGISWKGALIKAGHELSSYPRLWPLLMTLMLKERGWETPWAIGRIHTIIRIIGVDILKVLDPDHPLVSIELVPGTGPWY